MSNKKIYLSYTRSDSHLAGEIARHISEMNIGRILDTNDLPAGADWQSVMTSYLKRADAMVLLISKYSTLSNYTRKEIEIATTSKKYKNRVIPVFLDGAELDDTNTPWILKRFEYISGSGNDNTDKFAVNIAKRVGSILEHSEALN